MGRGGQTRPNNLLYRGTRYQRCAAAEQPGRFFSFLHHYHLSYRIMNRKNLNTIADPDYTWDTLSRHIEAHVLLVKALILHLIRYSAFI